MAEKTPQQAAYCFVIEKISYRCCGTLKPGGVINIRHRPRRLFRGRWQRVLLDPAKTNIEQVPYTKPAGAKEGEYAGTNLNVSIWLKGAKINTIAVRKKSDAASLFVVQHFSVVLLPLGGEAG